MIVKTGLFEWLPGERDMLLGPASRPDWRISERDNGEIGHSFSNEVGSYVFKKRLWFLGVEDAFVVSATAAAPVTGRAGLQGWLVVHGNPVEPVSFGPLGPLANYAELGEKRLMFIKERCALVPG